MQKKKKAKSGSPSSFLSSVHFNTPSPLSRRILTQKNIIVSQKMRWKEESEERIL